MAKKEPTAPDAGAEAQAASETKASSSEPQQAKEPKAKAAREPKTKTAREPKAEKAKADSPKTESAAPAAEVPATAVAEKASPEAPAVAPLGEPAAKKKGKRPGAGPRHGKKLRGHLNNTQQKIAKESPAPLKQAIALLKQIKRAKFDETVEIHMSLGVDTTQTDQLVRGTVALPHGIGKTVRVVVFCQGDNVTKAKEAGADFAGSDELIKKIQGEGWLDFDVALATQDMMGQVSRLGKILGPRGLMPTPKAGTVVTAGGDVASCRARVQGRQG